MRARGRRGQTDRDKEHFRTRTGRDQGPRICCCWQGEAQENPRESHTWVPTLPLIRSLPFVFLFRSFSPFCPDPARPRKRVCARVPHSCPSLRALWPLSFYLLSARSPDFTHHPWGIHYLSFFSTSSLVSPRVQMARTIFAVSPRILHECCSFRQEVSFKNCPWFLCRRKRRE